MSVYGVSYSVAQDNIVSIYNKFEKVVTLNGLTNKLFEIEDDVPMDKDDGLGYFEPDSSTGPVSIVEHIRTKTKIQEYIDYENSKFPGLNLSLNDFVIDPYVYVIELHDANCYALKIKVNDVYSSYFGDWYYELSGVGFPNVFLFSVTYHPLLHSGRVFGLGIMYYYNSFSMSEGSTAHSTIKNFTVTSQTLESYFNS